MANQLDIRLTPWDAELCMMVESLTQRPCKAKNGGNHYFIEVDYSLHNDPDYISAIYDAIAGRVGDRLIRITDDPDGQRLIVRIRFHKHVYPKVFAAVDNAPGEMLNGDIYTNGQNDVYALQVTLDNCERLIAFVGNGQMEVTSNGKSEFHFTNQQSVYAHAPESSYIVYVGPEHYRIVDKDNFEGQYTRK